MLSDSRAGSYPQLQLAYVSPNTSPSVAGPNSSKRPTSFYFIVGAVMGVLCAIVAGAMVWPLDDEGGQPSAASRHDRHEGSAEGARGLFLFPVPMVGARASTGGSAKSRTTVLNTRVATSTVAPPVVKRAARPAPTDLLSAGL